jgi:hypothetical protein
MARINDLNDFNHLRGFEDYKIGKNTPVGNNPTYKIKNIKGDDIIITPKELREELHNFIDNELLSQTQEEIEKKRKSLKLIIDNQLNEFEVSLKRHVNEKITKITEEIIERTMERVFEDRVKQEVRMRIKKLLDE